MDDKIHFIMKYLRMFPGKTLHTRLYLSNLAVNHNYIEVTSLPVMNRPIMIVSNVAFKNHYEICS